MVARNVSPIFGTSWTTAQRLGQTRQNGKSKSAHSDRHHMMRRPLLVAIIAFLAALALRVANAPMAFAGGAPDLAGRRAVSLEAHGLLGLTRSAGAGVRPRSRRVLP